MITWFGIFILWVAYRRDHPAVRLTKNRILRAWSIYTLSLLGTGVITLWLFGLPESSLQAIKDVKMWQAVLAGFEDAVFVLPALMMEDKYERGTWLILSSCLFTSGHSYQGYGPMFAKVFTVPVVYLMASEWGILTTMTAHALNDVFAIGFIKLFGNIRS